MTFNHKDVGSNPISPIYNLFIKGSRSEFYKEYINSLNILNDKKYISDYFVNTKAC